MNYSVGEPPEETFSPKKQSVASFAGDSPFPYNALRGTPTGRIDGLSPAALVNRPASRALSDAGKGGGDVAPTRPINDTQEKAK